MILPNHLVVALTHCFQPDQDSLAFDNENWREWHEAAGVEISTEEAEEQAELMASKMNDDQLRAFHTITEAIYQKIQGGEKTNRLYFLQVNSYPSYENSSYVSK